MKTVTTITMFLLLGALAGCSRDAAQDQAEGSAPALLGTNWALMTLSGRQAALGNGQRRIDFELLAEDKRVHGFSGCNTYNGGYELNEDALTLSRLASTRMACPDGMDLEQKFLEVLGRVEGYRIDGHVLKLRDAAGADVASFEPSER